MAQVSTYIVSRIVMVVIGVLVAAAIVIGVIYLLEHRGAQVRHDQSSQIAAQGLKQQQQSDKASTGTSTKPVSAPSTTTTTSTTVATTASPEALPTTGMSDSVAPILILAVLAFATTSYVVSRRSAKAL